MKSKITLSVIFALFFASGSAFATIVESYVGGSTASSASCEVKVVKTDEGQIRRAIVNGFNQAPSLAPIYDEEGRGLYQGEVELSGMIYTITLEENADGTIIKATESIQQKKRDGSLGLTTEKSCAGLVLNTSWRSAE